MLGRHDLNKVFSNQIVRREITDAAFNPRGMDAALCAQNWPRLWLLATESFSLPGVSIHGSNHWIDVEHHARPIASETGADETVCRLFAWFHDVARQSEGSDPQHGPRAAAWLESHRDELGQLTEAQWSTLRYVVRDYTKGRTSSNPTIGACWDADRLDLWRLGIEAKPELLSTQNARNWQANRAAFRKDLRPQSFARWFINV